MSNDDHSPSGSELVKTVAGRQLAEASSDVFEVALDSVLTNGVLKELPIVGILAKLAHAGWSISEELFVRKLLRFLCELRNISADERLKLLDRYPDGTEKQRDLGENLLQALERLDNVEKPHVLARFFVAYIREQIDYATFSRLAQALERFNLVLMSYLRSFYSNEPSPGDVPEEIKHELSLAGMITVDLASARKWGGGAKHNKSEIGRLFLEFGFSEDENK